MTATKQQPIAGYRISDPSDPELGFWFSDTPCAEGYTSEPLYAGAATAAVSPQGEWRIDTSTGRGILVYKNCSVIEAEQAPYVLGLIAADAAAAHAPDQDADLGRTVDQRDTAEGWADGLAGLIGKYFGRDIGEHSSAHCPWQEAKDIIEEAEPYQPAAAAPQGEHPPLPDAAVWSVAGKDGMPTLGKGWMFSPVQQGNATLPLFTARQMWAYHDLGRQPSTAAPALEAPAAPAMPAPRFDLHKFYGVQNDTDLIAAQARHIEKLQAKLAPMPAAAIQRVREG